MYLTIAKWVAVVAAALAVIGVPIWYVDKVKGEAYKAGWQAAKAECEQDIAAAQNHVLSESMRIVESEAEKARKLATDLAIQRKAAKTLKDKLDVALSKQPEATGCKLNDDVTDLLRFAANGDFSAASEQHSTISGTHPDEVSRDPAVPNPKRT